MTGDGSNKKLLGMFTKSFASGMTSTVVLREAKVSPM